MDRRLCGWDGWMDEMVFIGHRSSKSTKDEIYFPEREMYIFLSHMIVIPDIESLTMCWL